MGIGAKIKMVLNNVAMQSAFKMITEQGNGFFAWNGKLFQSDMVRACVRPYSKAIGKLKAKHIRNFNGSINVNPDVYMRFFVRRTESFNVRADNAGESCNAVSIK